MTDAPFLYGGTVPGVDPATGKIWPQFLPDGIGGGDPGISLSVNAAGDTVLTIAAGSTAASLTTNANGDAVLTLTGA
jgi:hypothetical protein